MPRHYLRHPIEIPIRLTSKGQAGPYRELSRDLGAGGLSCVSGEFIAPGSPVEVNISLIPPGLSATGQVIWCQKSNTGFLIGIGFDDPDQIYSLRMIEQLCQIESYRLLQSRAGRTLSSEQAAEEWIKRHAADFPAIERLQ